MNDFKSSNPSLHCAQKCGGAIWAQTNVCKTLTATILKVFVIKSIPTKLLKAEAALSAVHSVDQNMDRRTDARWMAS